MQDRVSRPRVVVALTGAVVVCGLVGLLLSELIAPPPGDPHSCPGGSLPSACRYPPDQVAWSWQLTVAGLAVGVVVSLFAYMWLAHCPRR